MQSIASAVPLLVMAMVVAPLRLATSAASIRSRLRPALETMTTQSPCASMVAAISCMWPSL